MLSLIGIGLNDEKDISLKGLEAVKEADIIYLESYTNKLNISIKKLEELYGKKIIRADRKTVESDKIIKEAKDKSVCLLIIGDIFSATTHITLYLEAKKENIEVNLIHNASILTAVGVLGLELYKYGHTISIPFNNENVTAPVATIKQNLENNLHTLILLDLDPINNKFLSIKEACSYLLKHGIDQKAIACQQLGSKNPKIKYASLENLAKEKFDKFPQCLVIPAQQLHFVEEEALEFLN